MQARTTLPSRQLNLLLMALVALGVGLLSILPMSLLHTGSTSTVVPGAGSPRVAYFEFNRTSDTLWLAQTADPTQRQRLYSVAHADEFGIVPSLAPDHSHFAYTVLPANTRAPSPDSPADVWLSDLKGTDKPRLLAQNVDLLVAPVWSPKSDALVYRRSDDYRLFSLDIASGQERQLVAGDGAALFPVGFAPDAGTLYYVKMTNDESTLLALDMNDASSLPVAKLSDGLTRDWKLSPAGDRIAYLAMSMDSTAVASRAFVLDIATGVATQSGPEADAFSPAWSNNGDLALGSLSDSGPANGGVVTPDVASKAQFAAPPKGFDVPLVFAPSGKQLVVRNFDGASAVNPGRERLEIVSADGNRTTITNDEVTFLGWIDP